jgi:hypothetical protein
MSCPCAEAKEGNTYFSHDLPGVFAFFDHSAQAIGMKFC